MDLRPHLSFCAFKTAWLAPELLVSIGPSPHVCFFDAKQRILDRINKSQCVPDVTCRSVHAIQSDQCQKDLYLMVPALIFGFCMQNSDFWSKISSLYGSQTSPVVLCIQNRVICTRMTSLYWFQPSSCVLCKQNSDFRTWLTSLYGSQTSSVVLSTHNSVLSTRKKILYLF